MNISPVFSPPSTMQSVAELKRNPVGDDHDCTRNGDLWKTSKEG